MIGIVFDVLLLYLAIGRTSLAEHAKAVASALQDADLPLARQRVGMIVSRDTREMNAPDVARAAVESVLENGADAVFGALFWFVVAGTPGVVVYRLANTLDAMWGYKNSRFLRFGWAAARFDDLLNLIPARLTALSYALMGQLSAGHKIVRLSSAAVDAELSALDVLVAVNPNNPTGEQIAASTLLDWHARLCRLLERYGLDPGGSTALFAWCPSTQAERIYLALAQRGILVRLFKEPPSLRFGLPGSEGDWQRWTNLPAVQRDNLYFIPPALIQRHSPRILEGAELLCRDLERARAQRKPR
jgi:hypothetical protein